MSIIKVFITCFLALSVAACTWVDLSEQAEKVRVLAADDVTTCKRVGKTTVKTAEKLAGLDRHEHKVQDELDTLARNSAVELDGDTVVRIGQPEEGRQVYEVYRCIPEKN